LESSEQLILALMNGLLFTVLGAVFLAKPDTVLKVTAKMSLRNYPKGSSAYGFFDRTPFGAIQEAMVGLKSEAFMDAAHEEPGRFRPMLLWIRVLGAISLLLGIGGIAVFASELL
jgi:hypothetical protein